MSIDLGGQVHTPFGDVKKGYLVGGGVVLVAIGIYYYRQKQAAASAAATDTTAAADTSAAIDTATGYPTGSPDDLAALAQQQATGYSTGSAGGGGGGSDSGVGYVSTPQTPGYSTNGAWSQAAENYLVQSAGADSATVAAALGKYIAGQQVTTAQQSVIQSAIAFVGYPPVSGTNGYPPSIQVAPAATTPPPPAVPGAPQNLRVLEKSASNIELGWNSLGAVAYQYHVYQGSAQVGTVFGTFIGLNGKKPLTTYGPFTVRAANKNGVLGPASKPVTVKTTK